MLAEIENGNELIFKGALHEKVVLCSSNKTFDVRNAEQSNSLLVIPNLLTAQATSVSPIKSPTSNGVNKSMDKSLEEDEDGNSQEPLIEHEIQHKTILKIFYEYLECRLTKPRVKKIQDLLHLTVYSGPENEDSIDRRSLFTRRQLFDTAQCSQGEFEALLTKIRCIEIDGYMRILDYVYEYRVVTLMLSLIVENSWSLDEIDKDESITALDGIIPTEITFKVFDFYTTPVPETAKFAFNQRMVCRIIARNVLQEGLKFHVDEFFETCQSALPEGMDMQEDYIEGFGIVDRESIQGGHVRGLFEENMPLILNDRLNYLFRTKDRWTMQQISPYLELFVTSQLTISALLAKHARSVNQNGTRFYVAKHQ